MNKNSNLVLLEEPIARATTAVIKYFFAPHDDEAGSALSARFGIDTTGPAMSCQAIFRKEGEGAYTMDDVVDVCEITEEALQYIQRRGVCGRIFQTDGPMGLLVEVSRH